MYCKVVLFNQSVMSLRLKAAPKEKEGNEQEFYLPLKTLLTYEKDAASLVYFVGDEMHGLEPNEGITNEQGFFLEPPCGWDELFYTWANGKEIKRVVEYKKKNMRTQEQMNAEIDQMQTKLKQLEELLKDKINRKERR